MAYADGTIYQIPRASVHFAENAHTAYFPVPLRNAGQGPALIRETKIEWSASKDRPAQAAAGVAAPGVLPYGELTRIRFTLPKQFDFDELVQRRISEGAEKLNFDIKTLDPGDMLSLAGIAVVKTLYTDQAGGQRTWTWAIVEHDKPADTWRVTTVTLFHDGESRAFAASQPGHFQPEVPATSTEDFSPA